MQRAGRRVQALIDGVGKIVNAGEGHDSGWARCKVKAGAIQKCTGAHKRDVLGGVNIDPEGVVTVRSGIAKACTSVGQNI